MASPLLIKKDNLKKLLLSVREMTSKEVLIGIPESTATRDADADVNNATLGYIHELGSPAQNIPARPFLAPGIEGVKGELIARMKKMGQKALLGNKSEVMKGFHAAGLVAAAAVKKKIVEGPFEPLSPVTIAKRAARLGQPVETVRSKPLIDTGKLLGSITYVIRPKRKG